MFERLFTAFIGLVSLICACLLSSCSYSHMTDQNSGMPFEWSFAQAAWASYVIAGGTAVIGFQKTLDDVYMTYQTKLDCSTPRALLDGGPKCRLKVKPPAAPLVYCFQTLGDVACYQTEGEIPQGSRLGSTYYKRVSEDTPYFIKK